MKTENITLETGRLTKLTYSREDAANTCRVIIADLYSHIPDLKETIYIQDVIPNDGKTIEDVVYEYVDKYHEAGLVFADTSTIASNKTIYHLTESANDTLKHLWTVEGALYNCMFSHVSFKRSFSDSNQIRGLFVYQNNDGKKFIDQNSGANGIISWHNESSKIL